MAMLVVPVVHRLATVSWPADITFEEEIIITET